jgi:hypothetical protein
MDSGAQGSGQSDVPGHDKKQAARAADARDVAAQYATIWIIVVAEHDAGTAQRQTRDRRTRVR